MQLRTINLLSRLWRAAQVVLLTIALTACSTPEEKAADYIENGIELLDKGQLEKAEIEFKNALQINQNLPEALYGMARIYEQNKKWPETYATLNKIRELAPQYVEARFKLANLLLASRQFDQALGDARDLLEMAPEDSRSHSLMATVRYLLEDYDGALAGANKALSLDPGNSDAYLVKARLLINEKKVQDAVALLDKAIESDPANVAPYLVKLQAYEALGNMKAVQGIFLTLIKQFPTEVVYKNALAQHYMINKNIDGAEDIMQQIVEADPASTGNKLRLVTFKYQYRSVDEAIGLANRYIKDDPKNYSYRFLLGELHERNNAFDKATAIYQKIIEEDGIQASGLEARNKLASIEKKRGNREAALKLIDEVLTQDLANKNGLLLRAEYQIGDLMPDEALVNLRTVLRNSPDSVRALQLSGIAYEALDSRDLAIDAYRKAIKLNPGSAATANKLARSLMARGDFAGADEILLESIASGNRDLISIQLLAQIKLALGQWEQAELLSKELQKKPGQEAYVQQVMGVVLQGKNDRQASIEAFKRAHELAPRSAPPINALFQTYVQKGQLGEARKFLQSVISVDADNLRANQLLARLNLYEQNFIAAIEQYRRVIELEPKSTATYHDLASIYVRQKNLTAAEKVTRQGLKQLPDVPILMMDLASIHEMKGDIAGAIETYELLLEKHPDQMVAKNNLASLLSEHGEDASALQRARNIATALRNSRIPQFRDTYAWTLVKSGKNLDEAISVLEGIVKMNTDVGVYSYHLGEAYRQKGDTKMALSYLQKATELSGADADLTSKVQESIKSIKQSIKQSD